MSEDALASLMAVAGDLADLAPDELEEESWMIEAAASAVSSAAPDAPDGDCAALPGPPEAPPLAEEVLAPIGEELWLESPLAPPAERHAPAPSAALCGLSGYTASAARLNLGLGKWRIQAILGLAALAIWCLYFLSGRPPVPGSDEPVAVTTTARPPSAGSHRAEPSAGKASPASRGSAAAVAPVAAPADRAQEVVELATAWARAWSEQRVDAYLEFYAREFRLPDELSRSEWEAQRRSRILGPRRIEVRLGAVEAEVISSRRARISFDQIYRSDSYSDRVRKTLDLVKEGGAAWKISAERALG